MIVRIFSRRLARDDSERGFALALVLGIGLALILLAVTATTLSVSGLTTARADQDSSAALAAAYAGVDEYESRLAADSSYGQYGNPNSLFTQRTGSSVIQPASTSPNPAFGVSAGGTWATIAGSNGTASFRYEVDNSNFANKGQLRIRSTGKVGKVTRSIVATVKGKGFIDFLYFTDYEIADPSLGPFDANGQQTCVAQHAWEASVRPNCTEITFSGGDILNGPVHSNDIMHICNATFTGTVTSAYSTSPYYSPTQGVTYGAAGTTQPSHSGCTHPAFPIINGVQQPTQDSSIVIPATNQDQLKGTRIDDPQNVPRPGCLYTGPTKITLTADGNMRVVSPFTKVTYSGPIGTPAPGVIVPNCGTPGSAGLGSAAGQVVPIPNNNIVDVQAVPGAGDPNYSATPAAGSAACSGANTNTNSTLGAVAVSGNGIGFPTVATVGGKFVNEVPPSATSYGCTAGDAFVQGALSGRLTISAANYVYVTGDITYANTDGDILGLVGTKAVWVWNPYLSNGTLPQDQTDRTIHAAILSLNDTFTVQNTNKSGSTNPLPKLWVTGAIAQKFRGVVSQNSGYIKRYSYDPQLATAAPPKFLAPVSTTYGTTSSAQVSPGFTANGSAVPLG